MRYVSCSCDNGWQSKSQHTHIDNGSIILFILFYSDSNTDVTCLRFIHRTFDAHMEEWKAGGSCPPPWVLYAAPPQCRLEGLGERRQFPQRGLGRSLSNKRIFVSLRCIFQHSDALFYGAYRLSLTNNSAFLG